MDNNKYMIPKQKALDILDKVLEIIQFDGEYNTNWNKILDLRNELKGLTDKD